jgi:hypothetical protein
MRAQVHERTHGRAVDALQERGVAAGHAVRAGSGRRQQREECEDRDSARHYGSYFI